MLRVYLNRDAEDCEGWVWFVENADGEYLDTFQVPRDGESGDFDIHSTTLYREMEKGFYDLSTERVEYIDGDYGPVATLNPEGV